MPSLIERVTALEKQVKEVNEKLSYYEQMLVGDVRVEISESSAEIIPPENQTEES